MAPKTRHNVTAVECDECANMLEGVHPELVYWFNARVRPKFPKVHVELGYRDIFEQEKALRKRESKFPFPDSPHNRRDPVDFLPASHAIDLMHVTDSGFKKYDSQEFMQIHETCLDGSNRVITGLDCLENGLYNHFELASPHNLGR